MTTTQFQIGDHKIWVDVTPIEVEGAESLDKQVISKRSVTLNAQYAERHIDLPRFRGERPVSESHVQFLRDEMAAGNFNEDIVTLATAELNGTTYAINGQHTCWAVVSMPGDYAIKVQEIRYRVNSQEQLRKLYATFDRLMARSDQHITQIHLVDMPEVAGVAPSVVKLLVPGFKFWQFENDRERGRYSPEQIATLIRTQYGDTFRRVAKFWSEKNSPHLKRAPVFAAMFAIFDRWKTDQPVEFWTAVADGIAIESKTDSRYRLREFLNSISMRASETKKRVVATEDVYRISVTAWNKWRAGEPVLAALRAPADRPKVR